MKRTLLIFLCLGVLSLVGCSSGKEGVAEISPAKLSKEDEILLNAAVGSNYFIGKISLHTDKKMWIKSWVEVMEKGQKTQKQLTKVDELKDKDSRLLFVNTAYMNDNKELAISVITDTDYTRGSTTMENIENPAISGFDKLEEPLVLEEGKATTLAMIAENSGNEMRTLSVLGVDDDPSYLEDIKKYDRVTLYKIMVSTKNPEAGPGE
ncbi:hypothetical protein [Pseudalkalibacillus caeni]|uniref:Lipoprotein n=1 Tax=Exobacillus caeni TaxID=2574798 RepID=A0A5R9F583_9BACL|nr:hypothetical protein [Pseudalkalibacillus caeni]TLS38191.1 hypothetical protein FCL54_06545 [Pseudalkalibacillus caeni]